MQDVAIIGAGELGGALAHVLARRDVASTIRLIDETGGVAAGKALDIMQSAPIERFATRVVGVDRADHRRRSGAARSSPIARAEANGRTKTASCC